MAGTGMKKAAHWTEEEVGLWLTEEDMQEYARPLRHMDGRALLQLSQADFQKPPLCRITSDDGKQLLEKIKALNIEHHMEVHKNGLANGHVVVSHNGDASSSSKSIRNGLVNGYNKELVRIPIPEPAGSQFPTEWGKTGVAFLYAICCFVFTTIVISIVHERVPPKEATPPLPDKFFDFFDRVEWAFSICEINGMILVILWIIQWSLLKHKSIIGRRFLFIVGTLYLYRCITMYITTLPVPGMHFKCSPKDLKTASQSNFLSRVWWYRFFQYLERNIQNVVPRSYQIPFSWRSLQWGPVKYSRIDCD